MDEPMVVRSMRLPERMETRMRAVAAARRTSVSTLIRAWIRQGLDAADGLGESPLTGLHLAELRRSLAEAARALANLEHEHNHR
jgi:hypothetical protein